MLGLAAIAMPIATRATPDARAQSVPGLPEAPDPNAPPEPIDPRDRSGTAEHATAPVDDGLRVAPRKPTTAWGEIWRGPFKSPRLFAMPVADVVGAYHLSLSGDGSLLQEPGVLTSAGVLAIGFGDVAQLEYRHTTAIGIGRLNAPVPAVGVQLQLPLRERPWWPAFAVAFRLGVPRRETLAEQAVDERVTDLYFVARLRLHGALAPVTLHGGARISSAQIVRADGLAEASRVMTLPTAGIELDVTELSRFVGEIGLAPQFRFDPAIDPMPRIDYGLLGRAGVRWSIAPAVVIDGSVGYQLEVARGRPADGPNAIVEWDIRLGGEVFVPWGAIACRAAGIFCE